jgi:hypothetical protein
MGGPGPAQAQQQQQGGAPQGAAADQDSIDAFVHPVVMQLNAMAVNSPSAPVAQIADLVRSHPADYDACIRAIHRLWGNQVALQISIAVPHFNLAPPGSPEVTAPPAAAQGSGEHADSPVDVDTDPITGEADVSTSVGPVTGHVTAQPPNRANGSQGQLTGGSVEVAGDVGPNTHAGASVGVDNGRTVSTEGNVEHRVSQNVAVGGTAHAEVDQHGEVRAQGGASIRLRLNDVTTLRVAGAVDNNGVLNQEVALEILSDPTPRVPISDDSHKKLRFFLRATEPTQGATQDGGGANVQVGIGGTF